jgi:hypothetical protein
VCVQRFLAPLFGAKYVVERFDRLACLAFRFRVKDAYQVYVFWWVGLGSNIGL